MTPEEIMAAMNNFERARITLEVCVERAVVDVDKEGPLVAYVSIARAVFAFRQARREYEAAMMKH